MTRVEARNAWVVKFKELNGRKPTHLEDLSWRVGWNMCESLRRYKQKENKEKTK
jgi:hypothetical protein